MRDIREAETAAGAETSLKLRVSTRILTDERHRQAIEVVGRFACASSDVARRRDDYLADAYRC